MKRGIVAGGILALAFGTGCSSRTQERVVVAPPPRVERRAPAREVIVVERTHVPKGRAYGWWKQHGYREVTLYYDGTSYYSRRLEPTLRAVVVYQREGKYYLPAEDDVQEDRRGHRHDRDRDD